MSKKLAIAAFSGLGAFLVAASSFAHPSGANQLRSRAQYLVATSEDWLFWDWHPTIVFGILAMTALYTLTITRWRNALAGTEALSKYRVQAFYLSMVIEWLLLDGPMHHLSDELLFSAHMFQHLGLQLAWAPLFLWSWHPWQLRPLVRNKWVRKVAYRLTRPVTAFFVYNGMTVFWHIPPMYNLALEVHGYHIAEHLLFMSTACIFWWPLIGCLKEVPRPGYGQQIFYVFANMFAMKILGIGISLQDDVIYTYYLTVPRVWGLTAIADQQVGGLLMWLPGGLLLWGGLGYVFVQLAQRGTPKRGSSGIAEVDKILKERKSKAATVASVATSVTLVTLLVVTAGCGKKAETPPIAIAPASATAPESATAPATAAAPVRVAESSKPQLSGNGGGGKLHFDLRFSPPAPKVGELFQVVTIARQVTSSEPLLGAQLEVDATMPHHGHGMMTDPKHAEIGGGAYSSKGFKLHMHGSWTFVVKAKSGDVTDELRVKWEQPPESL